MKIKTHKPYSRRDFIKIVFTSIWSFFLASCKFPFQNIIKNDPPLDTSDPYHKVSNNSTETPTDTANPSKTEPTDLSNYGRLIDLFGVEYFVPYRDIGIDMVISANYIVPDIDLNFLVSQYQQLYSVDQFQIGTFYSLPQVDSDGNFLDIENNALQLHLGNYDRVDNIGDYEIPVYDLDEDIFFADILLVPDNRPIESSIEYSIYYYDLESGNLKSLYLDYKNLKPNIPTDPLTIEALKYGTIEEFKTSSTTEIEERVRIMLTWHQEVISYGYTMLAFVFNSGLLIIPFILDKKINTTNNPNYENGDDGEIPVNPIPTQDPRTKGDD